MCLFPLVLLLFVYPHYTNTITIVNVNHQQFQNNSRIIYLPHGCRLASPMPIMARGIRMAASIVIVMMSIVYLVVVGWLVGWLPCCLLAIEFNESLEDGEGNCDFDDDEKHCVCFRCCCRCLYACIIQCLSSLSIPMMNNSKRISKYFIACIYHANK